MVTMQQGLSMHDSGDNKKGVEQDVVGARGTKDALGSELYNSLLGVGAEKDRGKTLKKTFIILEIG